jgi:hypothetical protein
VHSVAHCTESGAGERSDPDVPVRILPAQLLERLANRFDAALAPGRSALFTTKRSAISINPAFMTWMPSPDSGTSMTTVVSAAAATSSSDCPTPTVSIRIRSKP